jgi:hypothetical protein
MSEASVLRVRANGRFSAKISAAKTATACLHLLAEPPMFRPRHPKAGSASFTTMQSRAYGMPSPVHY